jgi:hypothetical protein
MEPLFIFILFAAVFAVALIANLLLQGKRRKELAALAARLGLAFRADKDPSLADRLDCLTRLSQGRDRYAHNVLSGQHSGQPVLAFDYHYKTGSGKNTHHHHLGCVVVCLPRRFPELLIAPENVFSKIAQAFGYDDIDFESAEFSRAFCVRSKDRRFAYDVCHPKLMEYLLANDDLSLELDDCFLALIFQRTLRPEQIEHNLDRAVYLASLIPEHLFNTP